jgi:hypothetical protein
MAQNRPVIPDDLLLEAAFGAGERATAAWNEWSRARDLGALEPAELRLLPPVYHNLRDGGVADADIAPLVKQMARSMWVRTRLLLHEAAAAVELLASHRIDSLLLKGAALVAGGYCDARVRPMSDFDLLVHPSDALTAASLLEGVGWRADAPFDRRSIAFRHAALLRKPETGCDLHWWMLWESRDAAADARFWRDAEPAALDAVPVRVLRPEHQLLHVIAHGTRALGEPPVHWIGDALAVLRTRGRDLDWELFAGEVDARRMAYPVGDALAYLGDAFGASVPGEIVAALRSRRASRRQRHFYCVRPDHPFGSIAHIRALGYLSLSQPSETPLFTRLLWLPRNLQYELGASSLALLPVAVTRRVLRKLAAMLKRR